MLRALVRPLVQNSQTARNRVMLGHAPITTAAANRVLKNTYLLLAATLIFSTITAGIAMRTNIGFGHPLVFLGVYFGLLFAVHKTINSAWGLVWSFALTGFLGLTAGTIVEYYIHALANGKALVMLALATTGTLFLGLSGYALVSRKDFTPWAGFVAMGLLVAFLASIVNVFFLQLPALALAVSTVFAVMSSAVILIMTSEIIRGGETNYIRATITLYAALYNLFLSLLHILSFFAGQRD